MTREETENLYKHDVFKQEFFSKQTFLPTEKMKIDIRFPDGYKAETFPAVFFLGWQT